MEGEDVNRVKHLVLSALDENTDNTTMIEDEDKILLSNYLAPFFNDLMEKYQLDDNDFTFGLLRSVLVGFSVNYFPDRDQGFMQFFFHSILDDNRSNELDELTFMKDYLKLLEPILPMTTSFLNQIPQQGIRHNKYLIRELKTAQFVIKNAQKQWGDAQTVEQTFWSDEYWAHKLAGRAIQPGSLVPIIEPDGTTQLYRLHPLRGYGIDKGLVAAALVPYDPKSDVLDIKIMFQGTHNLASVVADTELGGPGSQTFGRKERYFLKQISNLIDECSQESGLQHVSLSLGGHSLGGSYAQLCTVLLLRGMALNDYHDNEQVFSENLSTSLESYKSKEKKQRNTLNRLMKDKTKFKDLDLKPLNQITYMTLCTQNSAGISNSKKDIGISLAAYLSNKGIKFATRALKVAGDPVQQTGKDNLFTRGHSTHVKYNEVKIINSGYEGSPQVHTKIHFEPSSDPSSDPSRKPNYGDLFDNEEQRMPKPKKSLGVRLLTLLFTIIPILPLIQVIKRLWQRGRSAVDPEIQINLKKKLPPDSSSLRSHTDWQPTETPTGPRTHPKLLSSSFSTYKKRDSRYSQSSISEVEDYTHEHKGEDFTKKNKPKDPRSSN